MSRELKKRLMNSLTNQNTGTSQLKQGCNMIYPHLCIKYASYCQNSDFHNPNTRCVKRKDVPILDDAFYDLISLDDLDIPFVSPEFIFRFDKELSDVLLMKHAKVYLLNRGEYDRLMDTEPNWKIFPRRTWSNLKPKQYDQKLQEMVQAYKQQESNKLEQLRLASSSTPTSSWTNRFIEEEQKSVPRSKPVDSASWTNRFIEEERVAPSSANLVVSDLPKSNSGVAKTEKVMEQVMEANVSKGMLSRKKSVEILSSPAAQHYADLRVHLTQDEVRQLDADMLAVHSGVEEILGQHLSTKDEKAALQALFDQYDLCQYVRTADKVRLTIPELTVILTSFGQVDKRVRQATTRSTICYIILSVVLMDPKTFIEKLAGINKLSH